MLFHTVALISLVFLVVGHDRPGGGFIGGLVAGTAFVLIYLAGGTSRLRRAPAVPEWYLGGGITLAAATGALSWLGGREFLEALVLSVELPVLGTITLASVLLFDLGVYLVVIGLVLALLRALGRETVRA